MTEVGMVERKITTCNEVINVKAKVSQLESKRSS